MRKEKRLGR